MNMLEDLLVIDFSQFLSGPSASLRLADMGAEVIKIEKPGSGDICRELYVSDVMIEDESTIFHAINRNKESFVADLKNEFDLKRIKQLLARADVLLHNFRPGVMERLGLSYEAVKAINPAIVYAEISGYGNEGPWKDLPGQDLLLQSVSGLGWLSNNDNGQPSPMGVAVVDILAGAHLVQGILAALLKRGINGKGSLVQVSMFESIIDFQFEVLTCYLNDGGHLPRRGAVSNANAYIGAPYGIYKTNDDFIALAMADIPKLGDLLKCDRLMVYTISEEWFSRRDEIKTILATHLQTRPAEYWLSVLQPAGIWCAPVYNYSELVAQDGYKVLEMEMQVNTTNGLQVTTTRCPIRFDEKILTSSIGAPLLGEHNRKIEEKYSLAKAVD